MHRIVGFLGNLLPISSVFAHCDIPCGIYDPHQAQLAAHTIIRMTQLLGEVKRDDETAAEHRIARLTHVKEEHAELIEHEIHTLWDDYFKEEYRKQYPELTDLVTKSLALAGKTRQEINMEAAQELLAAVQDIAEIFYKSKGAEPVRVKALYPTGGEIVFHK